MAGKVAVEPAPRRVRAAVRSRGSRATRAGCRARRRSARRTRPARLPYASVPAGLYRRVCIVCLFGQVIP